MILYTVGWNRPGYLRESAPYYVGTDRAEAVVALRDLMQEYADSDDDAAWDLASQTDWQGYGDEAAWIASDSAPSMRAQVDAALRDDDPDDTASDDVCYVVTDNDDRHVAFWLHGEEMDDAEATAAADAWEEGEA